MINSNLFNQLCPIPEVARNGPLVEVLILKSGLVNWTSGYVSVSGNLHRNVKDVIGTVTGGSVRMKRNTSFI